MTTCKTRRGAGSAGCPIKPLIVEFEKLTITYDKVQEAGHGKHNPRFEQAEGSIWDRMDAVKAQAMTLSAHSIEGALFQIALCNSELDLIHSDNEPDAYQVKKTFAAINRMLYSAMTALCKGTGKRLSQEVRNHLMREDMNTMAYSDRARRGQAAVTEHRSMS